MRGSGHPPGTGDRHAGAFAAAVLIACLLCAAPANALVTQQGGISYVDKNYNGVPKGVQTFTAACPKGTHVYGGGEYNTSVNPLSLAHSYPYDDAADRNSVPDDGWRVVVKSSHAYNSATAYATCMTGPPSYVSGRFSAKAGSTHGKSVPCPVNDDIVSGGTRGSAKTFETESWPIDTGGSNNQWQLFVDNTAQTQQTVHYFAVCTPFWAVSYAFQAGSAPAHGIGEAQATCPGDNPYVLGGGQYVEPADLPAPFGQARIFASFPTGFQFTDPDSWVSDYVNRGDSEFAFGIWADCIVGQ